MLFRSGDGSDPRYQALADDLIKLAWDQRGVYTIDFLPIAEGIRVALEPRSGPGPLLIGDYTDNPGGGAHGDGTSFLKALLESKVEDAVVGHIADPESAKVGIDAGIGATVTLDLGGKTDPRFGGGPLDLQARILLLGDGAYVGDGPMIGGLKGSWGRMAVIKVQDIEILVATAPQQALDLQQFRAFGIDPAAKRVVALKSMQHFRAAFEPIADRKSTRLNSSHT